MNKIPDGQLNLDFDKLSSSSGNISSCNKPSPLMLVHSVTEISREKKQTTEREKILSDVVSYAKLLNW